MARRLARLFRILQAADQAYESGHDDACLILLYSLLDVLGSASRAACDQPGTGADFRRWIEEYVLPHLDGEVTAEDLWGARCGLLHALSQESRWTTKGKARIVLYARVASRTANGMPWSHILKQSIAAVPGISKVPPEQIAIVRLRSLLDAVNLGFAKFTSEVIGNEDRDRQLTENLELTLTTLSIFEGLVAADVT